MELVHFIPPTQRRLALMAAESDSAPVLIVGGSGTGKGKIAKWIHDHSARSTQPFVVGTHKRPLLAQLESAQGGTFLITEIAESPLSEQILFLKLLTQKAIAHPENPSLQLLFNVRIMVTTSHNLEGRALGGLFNQELLEKLNVFRIEMPDLKDRQDELRDIVTGIFGEITRETHKEFIREISPEAWARLREHDYPGNMRELRNILRAAITQAQGEMLEVSDLPVISYGKIDFRATREEFERAYLQEVLSTFDWDLVKTSEMTGMKREIIQSKILTYNIRKP